MDLSPHMIVIPMGTFFYRVVEEEQKPLIPTGKKSRFVSESTQYTNPEDFAKSYTEGRTIFTGTAATCVAYDWSVAYKESKATNKVICKLTLNANINAVDMDSICAAEEISKPYMIADHDGAWQHFYGKEVQAVHYESLEDKTRYNLTLFPDWIPNFKSLFTEEKITISLNQ